MQIRANHKITILNTTNQTNTLQITHQFLIRINQFILIPHLPRTQHQNVLQHRLPLFPRPLQFEITLQQNRNLVTNRLTDKFKILFCHFAITHPPNFTITQNIVAVTQQLQQIKELLITTLHRFSEIFTCIHNENVQLFCERIIQNVFHTVHLDLAATDYQNFCQISYCCSELILSIPRLSHPCNYLAFRNCPFIGIHLEDKVLCEVIKRTEQIPTYNRLVIQFSHHRLRLSGIHFLYDISYHLKIPKARPKQFQSSTENIIHNITQLLQRILLWYLPPYGHTFPLLTHITYLHNQIVLAGSYLTGKVVFQTTIPELLRSQQLSQLFFSFLNLLPRLPKHLIIFAFSMTHTHKTHHLILAFITYHCTTPLSLNFNEYWQPTALTDWVLIRFCMALKLHEKQMRKTCVE